MITGYYEDFIAEDIAKTYNAEASDLASQNVVS